MECHSYRFEMLEQSRISTIEHLEQSKVSSNRKSRSKRELTLVSVAGHVEEQRGDHTDLCPAGSGGVSWLHPFVEPQLTHSAGRMHDAERRLVSSGQPILQLAHLDLSERRVLRAVVAVRHVRTVN